MAFSFGTSGSLPSLNAVPGQSFDVMPKNPASKALNYSAANGSAPNMSTNNGPVYAPPPKLPIKNQTIVAPDGTKHTTTYDTSEASGAPNSSPNQTVAPGAGTPGYTYTNGILSSVGGNPTGTSGILASTGTSSAPPSTPSVPTQPSPQVPPTPIVPPANLQTATTGLLNSGQGNSAITNQAQAIENNYKGLVSGIGGLGAGTAMGDLTSGSLAPVGQGTANAATNAESNAINAVTQEEQNQLATLNPQLTAQSQTQSGLESAGQLSTPSSQFTQVSPGNYLADSQGNAAGNGQEAGIQAATNWAIAQQNLEQGKDYQGQAQSLSNALQTLAPVQQAITPYMSANALDSQGVPFVNQQINKINAQTNPAAYATMEAAISEARSYAIQLLGSQSGANPTDVTNSVNSYNFDNFTPAQLNTFLDNLNALGQYRLSQAQSASQAGYGANAQIGTPAEGMIATPGTPLESGGANGLNNLPDPVKALAGGLTNITSGVLDALGGATSDAAGAAAGATAASVLGL